MSDEARRDNRELLSAAVDQQLTDTETATLDELLRSDARYQRELDLFAAVKAATARAFVEQDLPATFAGRLSRGLDAIDLEQADEAPAAERPLPFWQRALRPAWAVAAVALLVLAATPVIKARLATPSAATAEAPRIEARQLAQAHRDWHQLAASRRRPDKPLPVLAAELEQKLGYEVTPPDLTRLNATLKVCSSCSHSIPGTRAAAFVMDRDGADLTLFEVGSPACGVTVNGFEPLDGSGLSVASTNGAQLALWSDGHRYACLVSDNVPADQLATMLPQALHLAHQQPTTSPWGAPVAAGAGHGYAVQPL